MTTSAAANPSDPLRLTPQMQRAARLSVLPPLVWPLQAACLAHAVAEALAHRDIPVWSAALFVGLALIRAVTDWRAQAAQQLAARAGVALLRQDLIRNLLARSPIGAQEDAAAQGSLIAEKLALIGTWAERGPGVMLRMRVLPLVVLALIATQSWTAALALAVTGPLIPLFMVLIGERAQAVSRLHLAETGALNRLLIDRVAALSDIRLLGAGAVAAQDLGRRADDLRERTMAVLRLAFLSSTVLEFLAALGVAMIAVQSGLSLLGLVGWGGWGGPVSAFGAVFILLLAPDFYQPLRDMAAVWHDRAAACAVGEELQDLATTGAARRQVVGPLLATPTDFVPRHILPLDWQDLSLDPGDGRLIPVADARVAAGQAVALVAPSGSGKSLMLATLAGLIPAGDGLIRFGGVPLDDDTAAAIRQGIGLIPQRPRFAAQSLGEWLNSAGHDPQDVARALALSRADTVVAALPQGLRTRLGETGGGVSGGEGRRLMLARALLDPPELLMADEPTADLDPTTAQAVIRALLMLRDRGTALLVASHDPVLTKAMDRRIMLDSMLPPFSDEAVA